MKKWAQAIFWFTHNLSEVILSQTIFRTNFIKLLLSDYTEYGIFVW